MIKIKDYDNNFDESLFISKVDNIFIQLIDAIMQRDLSNIKHYLSNEVYNKYNTLIDSYKNDKKIRIFEEMNVKSSAIIDSYIKDNNINIEVVLTSRYIDYFINEEGEYLSGNNSSRVIKNNYITLSKKLTAKDLGSARRCPSCGNTLNINQSGVCPYCKNTIDMSNYDYIVTSMEVK